MLSRISQKLPLNLLLMTEAHCMKDSDRSPFLDEVNAGDVTPIHLNCTDRQRHFKQAKKNSRQEQFCFITCIWYKTHQKKSLGPTYRAIFPNIRWLNKVRLKYLKNFANTLEQIIVGCNKKKMKTNKYAKRSRNLCESTRCRQKF